MLYLSSLGTQALKEEVAGAQKSAKEALDAVSSSDDEVGGGEEG